MNGSAPTISITMPIYNGADFLAPAVRSALNQQTVKPLEIILFDDASTDTSRDVMDSFAGDPLIRAVKLANRLPTAAAWNAAVRETRGDYVLVLAQDDLIDSNFIAASTEIITRQPEIDLIVFGHRKIDDKGTVLCDEPLGSAGLGHDLIVDPQRFTNRFAKSGQFFFPSAVVFRRATFDAIDGFDEQLRYAYDWDFYLRTGAWAKIWIDSRVLCSYRIHAAQAMTAFVREDNGDVDRVFSILAGLGPPDGRLNQEQIKWVVEGSCDFLRQRVSKALRDPAVPATQVLEIRQRVVEKLTEWQRTQVPHARYVSVAPATVKRRIVWSLSSSRLGVRLIRGLIGSGSSTGRRFS